MPPQLALLLCTVFVLFLLRLERKQAPEVSGALWIPTIWMLCTASKPWSTWLGWGSESGGSEVDQVFLIGLLFLGLIRLVGKNFDWSRVVGENPWLVLLIGYMLVSIIWSDIPYISFKRWVRELVAVVMALVVLAEQDPRKAMQSIFRRTAYVLIPYSVLLIKYFPDLGRRYSAYMGTEEWTGVAMQKNGLGRLCLISVFYLIWALIRRRQRRDVPVLKYQTLAEVFVILLALWLLKGPPGGYSATAVAALAIGLATFFSLLWMKRRRMYLGANTLTVVMAVLIIFGTATVMTGGATLGTDVTSTLGRDRTLTGRTEIWADLLPEAMRTAVLGHGFGGFWTVATAWRYNINEAHNGYLEIILDLGFVGILLFSMFLLSCCRKARKELVLDFDWGALWICFLLMAAVHNAAESSLNSFTSHLTAILLFLAVLLGNNREPSQRGLS